jgi:alkylhydroperoxidase/carboxymuconolactone decarboxylase family protein YurZ
MLVQSAEDAFRRLTIGDAGLVAEMADPGARELDRIRLDLRTETLLRIGALIALDAPSSSYRTAVDAAQMAGAGLEDLLAVLIAVAGPVGSARVMSAAPRIALAAGYDVEAALEEIEPAADGGDVARAGPPSIAGVVTRAG